jgi:hypothetical protein
LKNSFPNILKVFVLIVILLIIWFIWINRKEQFFTRPRLQYTRLTMEHTGDYVSRTRIYNCNFILLFSSRFTSCIICGLLFCLHYEVVLESSRTVIDVSTSVKANEKEGEGHTSASLLDQSVMWYHAVNPHCLSSQCSLGFVFSFVCYGWQNRATCLH